MKPPANIGLDLTIPDAAQRVLWPLCLLSGLAAQAGVGWAESTRLMTDRWISTVSTQSSCSSETTYEYNDYG